MFTVTSSGSKYITWSRGPVYLTSVGYDFQVLSNLHRFGRGSLPRNGRINWWRKRWQIRIGIGATLAYPFAHAVLLAAKITTVTLCTCLEYPGGEGLVKYGFRQQAAELVTRLMSAVVQSLKAETAFHRTYLANTGQGVGEHNALEGWHLWACFWKCWECA